MHTTIWLAAALYLPALTAVASDFTERTETQGLTTAAGDRLGRVVATDGTTTVVGGIPNGGAPGLATVFRGCGSMTQVQELDSGESVPGDQFGFCVAIDGDVIVVGARQLPLNGTGAAYVFRFDGAQWVEEQQLTQVVVVAPNEWFGYAVDLDGDRLAVSALFDSPSIFEGGYGSVFVYRDSGSGFVTESGGSYVAARRRSRIPGPRSSFRETGCS